MKRSVLWLVLIGSLVASSLVLVMNRQAPLPLPTALTQEQVEALPDTEIITAVTIDLRSRLQASGPDSGSWRSWPEPAQHVLAWSWVEGEIEQQKPRVFTSFAALLGNQDHRWPSFDEIAAAYDALQAPSLFTIVIEARDVAAMPFPDPSAANPFAAIDQRFIQRLGRAGTTAQMRIYMRQHAAELVAKP
jgi:hypothetical protein